MKTKKLIEVLFVILIMVSLFPTTAMAIVNRHVTEGETFDLTTQANDGDYIIVDGITATITGSKCVTISLKRGATLTLDGVSINYPKTGRAPIIVEGTGNKLIIKNTVTLTQNPKTWDAGIRLIQGRALEIIDGGNGVLNVQGGNYNPAIGGQHNSVEEKYPTGQITITSGTVNATGGWRAAGIGGADKCSGGTTIINGGTVNATGGGRAAGIGGGSGANGGTVTINGGTVNATGGERGAGIGGGELANGGTITINGGTVNATGTLNAAGIGGGGAGGGYRGGAAGTININGGVVTATAAGGEGAGIGTGTAGNDRYTGRGGSITISNDALVYASGAVVDIGTDVSLTVCDRSVLLLEKNVEKLNTSTQPSLLNGHVKKTLTDSLYPMAFSGNTVYGITVPNAWTTAAAGYFRLKQLSYDANGGTGTTDATEVCAIGGNVMLSDGSTISKTGYTFIGWNTAADGSGTSYSPSGTFSIPAADTTLYAEWSALINNVTIDDPIMVDNIINNTENSNVAISGEAEPDAEVTVVIRDINGQGVTKTVTSGSDRKYSVTGLNVIGLVDGTLTVEVTAKDALGNIGSANKRIEKQNVQVGVNKIDLFINKSMYSTADFKVVSSIPSNVGVEFNLSQPINNYYLEIVTTGSKALKNEVELFKKDVNGNLVKVDDSKIEATEKGNGLIVKISDLLAGDYVIVYPFCEKLSNEEELTGEKIVRNIIFNENNLKREVSIKVVPLPLLD
ncbi:InlB B-repeat-containing protein [Tepidibacter sp. Z1-5]|uniref:InlB B-repeat-containing protein n=1 Tax=Tepidibacter sp. Z1-5 TaxID=3134138 RepID=UPI0030BD44A2